MIVDPALQLVASWTRNAAPWIDAVRRGTIDSRTRVTNSAILEAVRAARPNHVLDLGCGEGWLCRTIAETGVVRITGVDASAPLVAAAASLGPGPFLCLDYATLAVCPEAAGGTFDVVVANFALLDDNVGALLAALVRITTPDARLVIQTVHPASVEPPHVDGWRSEEFAAFGAGDWAPMPWYFRTIETWHATLAPTWTVRAMRVPLHPATGRPASLLLEAQRAG